MQLFINISVKSIAQNFILVSFYAKMMTFAYLKSILYADPDRKKFRNTRT